MAKAEPEEAVGLFGAREEAKPNSSPDYVAGSIFVEVPQGIRRLQCAIEAVKKSMISQV